MERKADISIIIVNYNVKDFLYQCLLSIRNSKHNFNIETIVVDNNSHDGSLEQLVPIFPEVEFISSPVNVGFGRANNIAIQKATGKYQLILNPDTILSEDTLQQMYQFMESNPNIGISGCKVLNHDKSFQVACRRGFPSPWAAFCKLFGLQALFPHSKVFASYNQLYKSIDETYPVDAVIGAFMFCRADIIKKLGGFDSEFFMYGEDLDLCYRVKQSGFEVYYFHQTSIIHFKGESAKRSSIDEVRHFYEAMEIFAKKRYGNSSILLVFLKLGIILRSLIAYLQQYKIDFALIAFDALAINLILIFSSFLRRGDLFPFPEYAYPTVFIILPLITFISMFMVGAYFESKPNPRKAFTGLLANFFVLSSLTYFFKEYAFSRGILLMTITFGAIILPFSRHLLNYIISNKKKYSRKKILVGGIAKNCHELVENLIKNEINIEIIGRFAIHNELENNPKLNVVGNVDYLPKIIKEYEPNEIIFCGNKGEFNNFNQVITNFISQDLHVYMIDDYRDLLLERSIKNVSESVWNIKKSKLSLPRFRFFKRSIDIIFSLFLLTIGLPLLYLLFRNSTISFFSFFEVLIGKKTLIGLNKSSLSSNERRYKQGVITLASLSDNLNLTAVEIEEINNFYLENFSFELDLDIFFRYFLRK